MKLKTLFTLFNVILFLSFAFIFFMPLPILGWEYALSFWSQNWAIALAFVAVLAALDSYFIVNWRLIRLLEREDWQGLTALLEAELKRKTVLNPQKTRIFLNSCLIGRNPGRISELRQDYQARRVRFLPRVALGLGLPLVLEGRHEEIEAFLGPLTEDRRTGPDRPWIRWSVAFARLLNQDAAGAKPLLLAGVAEKQPVLRLLSLYLLDNLRATDPEVAALLDRERPALARGLTDKEWQLQLDRTKERVILVLFMDKLIAEAREWLAREPQGAAS